MSDYDFPTADQLDRLRAGLLDDDLVLKKRIQDSLAGNPASAADGIWERLGCELDGGLARFPALGNQLRLRRRAVLTGTRRRWPGVPVAAAAAMASLVLFVAIMWFPDWNDAPTPKASAQAPQVVAKVADYRVQASADDSLDLANNLDFYVWLANQRHPADARHDRF